MEIKKIIDNKSFSIPKEVLEQKDLRLSSYSSLLKALKEGKLDEVEGDSIVLVLSYKGIMYEVNFIGALIWECLKNNKSFNEIVSFISEKFQTPNEEQVSQDIEFFIEELIKKNFMLIFENN